MKQLPELVTKEQRREFRRDMCKYHIFQRRGAAFFQSKRERKKPTFEFQMEQLRAEERTTVSELWKKYGDGMVADSVRKQSKRILRTFFKAAIVDVIIGFTLTYGLQALGVLPPLQAFIIGLCVAGAGLPLLYLGFFQDGRQVNKPLRAFRQLESDKNELIGSRTLPRG